MIVDRRRGSSLYPIISGERRGLYGGAVRMALGGAAAAYSVVSGARMRKYLKKEKTEIGVPVVSVGNITVGGTGKTPVCRYLARRYERKGLRVGIATRGYGREGGGTAILHSGEKIESWHHCGDEAVLFTRGSKNVTVAVNADRAAAARALERDRGCDMVLMDDGFQFVTLKREVDIVVLDGYNPLGFGKLIPAGLLREPVGSLERANVFWLAKADVMESGEKEVLVRRLREDFPGRPIVESIYRPLGFSRLRRPGDLEPPESFDGMNVLCISGIGTPESFENLVEKITGRAPACFRFTDHHAFGANELEEAEKEAMRTGADMIFTTEKDAVRIPEFFKPKLKWRVLEIGVKVTAMHGFMEGVPLFGIID